MCIFFTKSPEGIPPHLKERQVVTPNVSTLTIFTKGTGPPTALCVYSSHFSTHYRAFLRVPNSSILSSTFLTSLIPHHSAAPSQKRGNQSLGDEKNRAFSARRVSCNMFDLLTYLQKVSLMKECIWGCSQTCASKRKTLLWKSTSNADSK